MHFTFAMEFFYIFLRKLSKTIKKHELYLFVAYIQTRLRDLFKQHTYK